MPFFFLPRLTNTLIFFQSKCHVTENYKTQTNSNVAPRTNHVSSHIFVCFEALIEGRLLFVLTDQDRRCKSGTHLHCRARSKSLNKFRIVIREGHNYFCDGSHLVSRLSSLNVIEKNLKKMFSFQEGSAHTGFSHPTKNF